MSGQRNPNLDKFDHLVVLMLENRSFDNLAGYLYTDDVPRHLVPEGGPPFNGVHGKPLYNLADPADPGSRRFYVSPAPDDDFSLCNPYPDPGEVYSPDINTQLYGYDFAPAPAPPGPPPMNGFVKSYLRALQRAHSWDGNVDPNDPQAPQVIMRCFTPEDLPVLSALARGYAISDAWFCSVPSQTFCNRSFFHSGTSCGNRDVLGLKVQGLVRNSPYVNWLVGNNQPTLFQRLEAAGLSWAVYRDFTEHPVSFSMTRLIHHPVLGHSRYDGHFLGMQDFLAAAGEGTLPAYSFIEPRMVFQHNDQHPPTWLGTEERSSVRAGELLIAEVYNALREGRAWERTLFVITYDEHGGCYDHVPPPAAPPPRNGPRPGSPGQYGFTFERFGVRLPTVLVSPWIEPGTVFRSGSSRPLDSTSILRTVCQRWGLEGLTERDRTAIDVGAVLDRETLRTDPVTVVPRPYLPHADPGALRLTGAGRDLVSMGALARGLALAELPELRSVAHAVEFIRRLGRRQPQGAAPPVDPGAHS